MPNWCTNQLTISHDDRKMIMRAAQAWEKNKFLNEFIPVPYELTLVGGSRIDITKITNMEHHREMEEAVRALNKKHFGYDDWYNFCCDKWGTKWDIGGDPVAITNNSFSACFQSAWAPPITAYETLSEMGFRIRAYYYEPGMAFCGRWDEGIDDVIQIPETAEEARKVIPVDIDEAMCITENMEMWEADNA